MWIRLSKVRFRAIVASGVLLYFGSQIGGKTIQEWKTFDEIQRSPVKTEAKVFNTQMAIKQSGGVQRYDVSYEFVAPGQGGSATSPSEFQAKLQEKFARGSDFRISKSELPKTRTDGKQYFSRTQALDPQSYNTYTSSAAYLSNAIVPVVYAANNPSNSLIEGTGRYPIPEALMISGLIALGGGLAVFGVAPCFRNTAPKLNPSSVDR